MKTRKTNQRICKACGDKKAVYLFHGRVRANPGHDLCFRCFRALKDRARCCEPVQPELPQAA